MLHVRVLDYVYLRPDIVFKFLFLFLCFWLHVLGSSANVALKYIHV